MDRLFELHWTLVGGGIYLLVCGGLGALIAYQNRRSILEGFLFGFFLGPIGIVWALFLRHGAVGERAKKRKREEDKERFRLINERIQPRSRKVLGDVDDARPIGGA